MVDDHRSALGPDHPGTVVTTANYAGFLRDLGRPREAAALYAEVLPAAEEVFGPDHPLTAEVRAAVQRR